MWTLKVNPRSEVQLEEGLAGCAVFGVISTKLSQIGPVLEAGVKVTEAQLEFDDLDVLVHCGLAFLHTVPKVGDQEGQLVFLSLDERIGACGDFG